MAIIEMQHSSGSGFFGWKKTSPRFVLSTTTKSKKSQLDAGPSGSIKKTTETKRKSTEKIAVFFPVNIIGV